MTNENETATSSPAGPPNVPPLASHAPDPGDSGAASAHLCPQCAQAAAPRPAHLYAIGKLEARFPSLGIERDFQQRLAMTTPDSSGETKRAAMRRVLAANPHLALRMCYVLMVSGYPAYIVKPAGSYLRESLFNAIGDGDLLCTVIGSTGPMAAPDTCQGLLAPIAVANQLYVFSIEQWLTSLRTRLDKVLKSRKIDVKSFDAGARELFERIAGSTENVGATDAHRALNYALMQHPGIFLAAAERAGRGTLDRVETRLIRGLGPRRLVAIVLTFLDVATGVPERLFCRVDITEEWPFVAGESGSARSPLGLLPFVENELFGLGY